MKTKIYNTFLQKMMYFDDDIDLIDILKTAICSELLTDQQSPFVLSCVDPKKHAHIARRQNSAGSRSLIINHLRKTLYTAYIKDTYEEVTIYLKTLLEKAAANRIDAGRLIGEHTLKMDAKTILEAGSWTRITELLTNSIFQSLESERSTLNLLIKISNKLALNVDPNIITDSLPYLEIRHFLIHTDGLMTDDFIRLHPNIRHSNNYIILDFSFINEFRISVNRLMEEFDAKVILANILIADELM